MQFNINFKGTVFIFDIENQQYQGPGNHRNQLNLLLVIFNQRFKIVPLFHCNFNQMDKTILIYRLEFLEQCSFKNIINIYIKGCLFYTDLHCE